MELMAFVRSCALSFPAEFVSLIALENQMHRELQEAWAANRVLDEAQATFGGNRWRTFVIGKEAYVIVRSVEIGMVKNIERIGFKYQLVMLSDLKLLGQAGVEAHLKWASKSVPACSSIQGFIEIAPGTVASGNPVGPRSHELGCEISGIELTNCRRISLAICARVRRLLGGYARYQRHNGVSNFVIGAVIQTRNRARIVIDAVGLPALRHSLATYGPAIGHVAQRPAIHELWNRIAVVDQKNVGLIEIRGGVVGSGSESDCSR